MGRAIQTLALSALALGAIHCAANAEQLVVDGQARTFLLERPNTSRRSPTVIMLHGANGTAEGVAQRTGLTHQGPQAGFAVVFPQSRASVWNRFSPGKEPPQAIELFRHVGGPPNDIGFLKILIADLIRRGLSDPGRIYLAGLSNGGFMTLSMFCSEPRLFASIGLIVSSMPDATGEECRPAKPLPVVIMNGTADVIVPYRGGLVSPLKPLDPPTLNVWSTDRLEAHFRRFNGCTQPPEVTVQWGPQAERIDVNRSRNCTGGPVHAYRVIGGTHGSVATTLHTGKVLLDFFGEGAMKSSVPQQQVIGHIMYRRYDAGTLVTGNVRRIATGEWLETNTRDSKWTFRATEERANELILYDASRHVYVKMDLAAKRMFVRRGAESAWVYLADIVWTDK
jgi:polyhydroxybutyrate depolymerase